MELSSHRHALPEIGAMTLRFLGSLLSPAGRRARLGILIFHRVLDRPDPLRPGECVRDDFDWQIRLLAENFNVLGLAEAIDRLRLGSLPSRAVCLTFDDGYLDNAENALPILQKHGVQATFFISSGFLDGSCMWNDVIIESIRQFEGDHLDLAGCGLGTYAVETPESRGQAAKSLLKTIKYLDPAERQGKIDQILEQTKTARSRGLMLRPEHVRKLAQAGMEIGGHTVTHPILARMTAAAARSEIAGGKEELEKLIRAPLRFFAYPNGIPGVDYTREHVRMVEDLGFTAALSTAWGAATETGQLYQLPRFTPWDATPARFALRLIQNYTRTTPEMV